MAVEKVARFQNSKELRSYLEKPGNMLEFENGVMAGRDDLVRLLEMKEPNDLLKQNFMLNGIPLTPEEKEKMFSGHLKEALKEETQR